jgi:hypothetical protein
MLEAQDFATADRVAEQFTVGMMPVSRGASDGYLRTSKAPDRMTEGSAGASRAPASPGLGQAVRTALTPWIRFLSADMSNREKETTSSDGSPPAGVQVRRATSPSACRCTATAWHFRPSSCERLIKFVKQMLSAPVSGVWRRGCWP